MVAMLKYLLNSNHHLPLLDNTQTTPNNTKYSNGCQCWLVAPLPLLSVDIPPSLSTLLSRYKWVAGTIWRQIVLTRLPEYCHGSPCDKQYPPSWPGYASEYSWQNLVSEWAHLIHNIGPSWYYGGYHHHQLYDHHYRRGKHSWHNLVPEHAHSTVWYCRMMMPILVML